MHFPDIPHSVVCMAVMVGSVDEDLHFLEVGPNCPFTMVDSCLQDFAAICFKTLFQQTFKQLPDFVSVFIFQCGLKSKNRVK